MAIGLSTYAFFWRSSAAAPRPAGLHEMLEETASLGPTVFQICDYPPIESAPAAELTRIRDHAADLGLTLELGTRGISAERLDRYRDLAAALGATFVRSMLNTAEHRPGREEAVALLRAALPGYQDRGLTLGLETYEQVATSDLVDVIRAVDSPSLGVCLDPANCVARLETPDSVIAQVAPYVVNLHIKDFAFSRAPGWVGFSLTGCLLGTGLLDYDGMVAAIRPGERGISQVVEHWLPRADTMKETCAAEREWTRHSAEFLLRRAASEA